MYVKRSEHVPRREHNAVVKMKVHSPANDESGAAARQRDSEEDERKQGLLTPFLIKGGSITLERSLARQKRPSAARSRCIFHGIDLIESPRRR